MKIIPETTKDKPYIEFKIYSNGTIELEAVADNNWSGIRGGFVSSECEGNVCKPEDLERYIEYFKTSRIKQIDKQIKYLQRDKKRIERIKL